MSLSVTPFTLHNAALGALNNLPFFKPGVLRVWSQTVTPSEAPQM